MDEISIFVNYNSIRVFLGSIIFYFYLYFSFSGATELASGISIFLGVYIPRNFKNPIFSRNLQDHWNRWNISLMQVLKEAIFYPFSLFVSRVFRIGPQLSIPISIFAVFIFLGFWQGSQMKYYFFSLYHALGLTVVFYFSQFDIARKYFSENLLLQKIYSFLSWSITFVWISFSYGIYCGTIRFFK